MVKISLLHLLFTFLIEIKKKYFLLKEDMLKHYFFFLYVMIMFHISVDVGQFQR